MTSHKRGQARSDVATAARALLEERTTISDVATAPELVATLRERTGCVTATAKKHLAQQQRLRRGEISKERRGGSRPDAGPTPSRESVMAGLDQLERWIDLRKARGEMSQEEAVAVAVRLHDLLEIVQHA